MEAKYARMRAGAADAFVDRQGCAAFVAERERAFRSELSKQRAARSGREIHRNFSNNR